MEIMASSAPSNGTKLSRRRFVKAALIGSAGLAFYSGELERHWIEISQTEVRIPGLRPAFDGMRIVQLSDIHLDLYTEPLFLSHAVHRINQLKPDAVFLTGDFVTGIKGLHRYRAVRNLVHNAAHRCASILGGLDCPQRYAVLGNHDVHVGAEVVIEALTENAITLLRNACLPIERSGARFWLAGLDDAVEGRPDPDRAIPAAIRNQPSEPVILMCHAPDYADHLLTMPAGRAVSLMLSGHTHGGQVRLPFIGTLQQTLPELGKKYIQGWFRLQNLQLHVNRGLGTVGIPFRFDCPPEISLITLRA